MNKYKYKVYRASRWVKPGVPDEHAYNMYLSIMQMLYRLGLWETILEENRLHNAWQKHVAPMHDAQWRKAVLYRKKEETC